MTEEQVPDILHPEVFLIQSVGLETQREFLTLQSKPHWVALHILLEHKVFSLQQSKRTMKHLSMIT